MLNELATVVRGLKNAGISFTAPNPRIQSVGKKKNLLVVRLNRQGKPISVSVSSEDETALLRRYVQNPGDKATPSFPAFNIPTPFRDLSPMDDQSISGLVKQLAELQKRKTSSITALTEAATKLLSPSRPHIFKKSDASRFRRCATEIADELAGIMVSASSELTNLKLLVEAISNHPHSLDEFVDDFSRLLAQPGTDFSRDDILAMQRVLFGPLDWQKRQAAYGTEAYWLEKAANDKGGAASLYLELAMPDPNRVAVSHPKTWESLNIILEGAANREHGEQVEADSSQEPSVEGIDAFTGKSCPLEDRFPPAPLARLGPFKPFSLNTGENKCLLRYGLQENTSFPVSKELAREFYNALRHLGSEQRLGITCKPIKNGRVKRARGKTVEGEDLLITYLEKAPDFDENLAEMFGGVAREFTEEDFRARSEKVLQALEARLKSEPDIDIQLLSLCVLNQGNNQLSLHRRLRVADVVRAARAWEAGVRNAPRITIRFPEAANGEPLSRVFFTPAPLDIASTINRIWGADGISGKREPSFQRTISVSDAYDVFLTAAPSDREKTTRCLGVLLTRMALALGRLGTVNASGLWMNERRVTTPTTLRVQGAKAVSLLGIFLDQLGHRKEKFMKEPTYQVGRLLALADRLHLYYCKYVRTSDEKRKAGKIDAPSELLGNAFFNTALDQPGPALAGLAARIKPYKGWADTYSGEESDLIQGVLRQMGKIGKSTDINPLVAGYRMTDADKAKLLLGYLADHSQSEPETITSTTENP